MGRLDCWVMATPETDMALKKLGLKNIKSWEYKKFDVKALMPLGEKGKEVDKILVDLIKKLRANGKHLYWIRNTTTGSHKILHHMK
ncbi:MAG: hypothetical protein NT178_02085 [Proteobacteria bacterium]|nr:hypothetical protein [Pseudomonadota bacterium]